MAKYCKDRIRKENNYIARCIFNGMTIVEISNKLDCSKSTVSNRIKTLFEKYNAKTRYEFIYRVFGEIVSYNKQILEEKNKEIDSLKEKISSLTINSLNK